MNVIWAEEDIAPDESLWRYIRADRFVEMIDRRRLYFASARQFEDPFEGATSIVYPHPVDPRFERIDGTERAFEELRRLTKISCWNKGDDESEAMWKLYASERKGVAIRTTASKLKNALRPFHLEPRFAEETPVWGHVRYVDLTKVRLNVGMLERFFYKHKAFESEHELRIAISLRSAEEAGVAVPESGISVPFEPHILIEEIILGPNLQGEDKRAVEDACRANELHSLVKTSSLLWQPRFI